MLNRVLRSLRRLDTGDSFNSYLSGLHRRGVSGVPTADEARKDFRASHRQII